jgi:hypothetical protein
MQETLVACNPRTLVIGSCTYVNMFPAYEVLCCLSEVFFSFLFLFGLQSMCVNDPLTHVPAPSSDHGFDPRISSTPSR